jgi:hypothetical protein
VTLPLAPTVGMRVLAPRDACAHTKHGAIKHLPVVAPVAIIQFDCGCAAYVPLRRLNPEPSGNGRCTRPGCRRTEWPVGAGTCLKHKTAATTDAASATTVSEPGVAREQPFDSEARPSMVGTSAPSPRGGRAAIDGRGTKAADAPLHRPASKPPPRGEQAAGRMADRGTGVPRSASKAGGGWATAPGAPAAAGEAASEEPPVAPPAQSTPAAAGGRRKHRPHRPRKWWTRERIIAAFQRYHREEGRSPAADAMNRAATRPEGMPPYATVVKVFGSWSAALVAADLPPNPLGRPRKAAA